MEAAKTRPSKVQSGMTQGSTFGRTFVHGATSAEQVCMTFSTTECSSFVARSKHSYMTLLLPPNRARTSLPPQIRCWSRSFAICAVGSFFLLPRPNATGASDVVAACANEAPRRLKSYIDGKESVDAGEGGMSGEGARRRRALSEVAGT